MHNKLIARLSNKKKISIEKSTELWEQSIDISKSNGHDDFAYISGIFKRMIGEKLTFQDFLTLTEDGEPTNSSGGTMPDHSASDGKPKDKKTFKNIKKNRNVEKDGDTDLDTEKDDDEVAKVN